MTSDKIDSSPPSADPGTRRVRLLLWIVGLCLWILAALGVYANWRARQTARDQTDATAAGADSTATATRGAADAVQPLVLVPSDNPQAPVTGWDPEGLPDFEFTDRRGRRITKQDLLGQPWAVSFIFTRCAGPCLSITKQMRDLQQATRGSQVRLVSITVDPKFDTPEILEKYAEAFGAEADRWLFLTGDQDRTYRLIRDSFRMPVQEMTGADRKPGWEVLHSSNILHVNARGVVVGKYTGTDDADVAKLRRALLEEAERLKSATHTSLTPQDDRRPAD